MDYLQFVSEAGSTKARHASSTRQRALRTLIAEWAARAHGRRSGDRAGHSAEGELWVWAQLFQLCCGPARAQAEQPGAKGTARSQPPAREGKRWLGHFLEAFRCWRWRGEGGGWEGEGSESEVGGQGKLTRGPLSLSPVLHLLLSFRKWSFPMVKKRPSLLPSLPSLLFPLPFPFPLTLSLPLSLFPLLSLFPSFQCPETVSQEDVRMSTFTPKPIWTLGRRLTRTTVKGRKENGMFWSPMV